MGEKSKKLMEQKDDLLKMGFSALMMTGIPQKKEKNFKNMNDVFKRISKSKKRYNRNNRNKERENDWEISEENYNENKEEEQKDFSLNLKYNPKYTFIDK